MKKFSIITIIIGLIFSACKKELSESQRLPALTSDAKAMTNLHYTSLYNDSAWSCGAGEWIYLTGEVTTHVIEQISDKKYHGLFESNFNHVTGIGAISGKVYNGGGILKGEVDVSFSPDNPTVNASTKEKLHFLSGGVGYDFNVESKYVVNGQGEVKIDYIIDKTKNCNE